MIQARELRIGNNIKNAGGHIVAVTPQIIADIDNGLYIGNPIPLTEEWLVKLGFEKEYESQYRLVFTLYVKRMCLMYNFTKTDKEENKFTVRNFEIDWGLSNHVHQLQNIYSALTGEELTYTP